MPKIFTYKSDQWAKEAAALLLNKIKKILSLQGKCSILLTGGDTAMELYTNISNLPFFPQLKNVSFYLGDERFDVENAFELNSKTIFQTLFKHGVPNECNFFPIFHLGDNLEDSLTRYKSIYPGKIDVMLFTVGLDGHIASIFPGDRNVMMATDFFSITKSSNHRYIRITITPQEIKNTECQFLFAIGRGKRQVLKKGVEEGDVLKYPFLLSQDIWILDEDPAGNF